MIRALFIVLTTSLVAATATAQDSATTIARRAAGQLEAAQAALKAADKASDRVRALTQTIRAYENGLTALREGLRRAAIREASLSRAFEAKRDRVSRLLGVLQSIGTSPTPLLLLHPSGPIGTARSGMIVAGLTPALQTEVETLKAELQEIALLRALQDSAADSLRVGLAGVQQARTELSQAVSNRSDLPERYLADPEALIRLMEGTETLEGFAKGLANLDRTGAAAPGPDFEQARGGLALPVAGTVLRRAGEADAAGIVRPGIVVATAPRALVTTPWAATIRYLGPLLDYGNVMILEPDDRYLLVLAGLDQVYGAPGQVLPAGAPVGLMGGSAPPTDVFLMQNANQAGAERSETLYMELRQNQRLRTT
jgi:septal ring factor EnvC (AmiA/AmiB activator)